MKITELMTQLQAIHESVGDLEVHHLSSDSWEDRPVTEMEVCAAGVGITLIAKWGPMDADPEQPLRVVLS